MKFAVIEDEQIHIELLGKFIEKWSRDRNVSVTVASFSSAERFLFTWESEKDFDVLFIDIQMKEMSGTEMVKLVKEQDSDIVIVYITGIPDCMEGGYEADARHYLLKPISQAKLSQCMDRIWKKGNREHFVLVQTKTETLEISAERIMFVEARGHDCLIEFCSQSGETFHVVVINGLSELENQLGETDFVKCHRFFVCRVDRIHRINREGIIMDNGSWIPVSRRMYNQVNQMFIRHFRRERENSRR